MAALPVRVLLKSYLETVSRLTRTRAALEAVMVAGGQFLSAGLRFLATIVLARALGPTEWGYLVIFSALTDLVAVYADCGVNTTAVRFWAGPAQDAPRALAVTAMSVKVAIAAVIVAAAFLFSGSFLSGQEIPTSHHWLFVVACGAGLLQSVHTFALSLFQARQRFVAYALLTALVNAIRIAFIFAVLMSAPTVSNLFAAFYVPVFIAVLVSGFSAVWLFLRRKDIRRRTFTFREFASFLAPLAVLNLVTIVIQRIDVFMINSLASPSEVGIYGLAYQVAFVFPLIGTALFASLLPKVSAMRDPVALRRYFSNVLHMMPLIFVATGVGAALLPFLIPPLLGEQYAAAAPVVSLLVVGFGINIAFNPIGLVFYAFNKPHMVTAIHVLQLPIFIVANIILIPRFQSVGAAYSGIIIRIFGICIIVYLTWRELRARSS